VRTNPPQHVSKSDLGNAGWQRDLSVSYNNVGDVQVAQPCRRASQRLIVCPA
jgi:hypothetical protein